MIFILEVVFAFMVALIFRPFLFSRYSSLRGCLYFWGHLCFEVFFIFELAFIVKMIATWAFYILIFSKHFVEPLLFYEGLTNKIFWLSFPQWVKPPPIMEKNQLIPFMKEKWFRIIYWLQHKCMKHETYLYPHKLLVVKFYDCLRVHHLGAKNEGD